MIIFARTRHHYDSYQDYWRLIELSGFQTCWVDEIDPGAEAVFVLSPWNGEVDAVLTNLQKRALAAPRRAKLVWWNSERPDAPGMPLLSEVVSKALRFVDQVWVGDRYYQKLDERQMFVPFGSHPDLALQHGVEPFSIARPTHQYDYAHTSYLAGRRVEIHQRLRQRGLREAPAGGHGVERDRILRSSAVLISTHQTPVAINEPLRWCQAAAYYMPLVSEHVQDPFPLVKGQSYIDATAEELPLVVKELSAPLSLRRRRELGNAIHQALCVEHPFRHEIEQAVKRLSCG